MNKQKYRFSLTRSRAVKIKYNTGITNTGAYYETYEFNSSEPITAALLGENAFRLADEFLGKVITVAFFNNGVLALVDDSYLVNENTREFTLNAGDSYVFSWECVAFEPKPSAFVYFETKKCYPAFSNLAINKSRANNKMNWSTALNSDLVFKNEVFDYLIAISRLDSIIFKIERYSTIDLNYYTIYVSLPFTKANCSFDFDMKQVTVDFTALDNNSYLEKKLNTVINIAKHGYKHAPLNYNIPAMLQIYVDGTETITNIVGGSATEVDVSVPEMPDDYLNDVDFADILNSSDILLAQQLVYGKWWPENKRVIYLYNVFRFLLIGRICEIRIVGGEPGGPAGYYYATTSDNQISQDYAPTSVINKFNNTNNAYYLYLDTNTRYLYIKLKSDNSNVYVSTQPLNTDSLLTPDSIAGTTLQGINNQYTCAVDTHVVHSVYGRILTAKKSSSLIGTYKLNDNDFAYDARAYKYVVQKPFNNQCEYFTALYNGNLEATPLFKPVLYSSFYTGLVCSSETQKTDTGLGAADAYNYYTYRSIQGSYIKQHLIPIGRYFWSGVSFYAGLSYNFIQAISPYYLRRRASCFFTLGTAIRELLQEVAPNIRFIESTEFSSFLYPETQSINMGTDTIFTEPYIYFTHISNLQAGLFDIEAQKIEVSLNDIFDLLQKAFQVYYFIDDDGYLHLEHISWFYGKNKSNNIQLDTTLIKDEYTKTIFDYGQGIVKADDSYLYSAISFTSDTDESSELFNTIEINCLESTCALLDKKEITFSKFRTDVDKIYAEAKDQSDELVMLLPILNRVTQELEVYYRQEAGCGLKGLNDNQYYLWPTNYKASSLRLLDYYRWNFASLLTDHCSYEPIERERFIKQDIQVPLRNDIDMIKHIQTRFGSGLVLSCKIDLDTRMASLTLLHKG